MEKLDKDKDKDIDIENLKEKDIDNSKEKNKKNLKKKHKNLKLKEEIDNVLLRKIAKNVKPYLNAIIGNYYWLLHIFIMSCSGIILLFNNNIYHLLVVLIFSCLDAVACIFVHDCPLTLLENKYMNKSMVDTKFFFMNNSNILYKCEHKYEKTLEFLTNMIAFLYGKIIFLILMKLFSFKVNNE
jgi:hypothetical protein